MTVEKMTSSRNSDLMIKILKEVYFANDLDFTTNIITVLKTRFMKEQTKFSHTVAQTYTLQFLAVHRCHSSSSNSNKKFISFS